VADGSENPKFEITAAFNHWQLSSTGWDSPGGVLSCVARSMVAGDRMPGWFPAYADDPDVQNASDDKIERKN
jgi:hypothetical protein